MSKDNLIPSFVIYFIRQGLSINSEKKDISILSDTQWEELFNFASYHGVLGITLDGIISCKDVDLMPKLLKLRWIASINAMETKYEKQCRVMARMAQFYNEQGFEMMVLKGYGLSLLYPKPEHRPCGDIDIWLFGKQKKADAAMTAEWGIKIDRKHHHHTVFYVDGVMVENHYDFVNVYAHLSARKIERRLHKFVTSHQPIEVKVNGQSIKFPCADFNALFLLNHSAGHFAASKICLRHILDWALFLKYYAADVDWESLESFAIKLNTHNFLYALNSICLNVIDIDLPVTIPVGDNNITLQNRVLNDILYPEFSLEAPHGGSIVSSLAFKYKRWRANEWKHHLVYRESMFLTFIVQIWSHLLKPNSLKS